MKNKLCIALLFFALPASAQVTIKTYGQHVGGNIVYTQEVTNLGTRGITSFDIGNDTDHVHSNASAPYTRAKGELTVLPVGAPDPDGGVTVPNVPPALFSGPTGWTASLVSYDHRNGVFLTWDNPGHPIPLIQPGQTATFRITVPKPDTAYLTGHYTAMIVPTSGTSVWSFYGQMEKLDTLPPVLSMTLTPNTIKVGKTLIAIAATITVTDNYDPASEIKLESITANQTLSSSDISGALYGTDDRSFKLKPVKGRVYTVTYSATDGSGNKAMASATVTVR